MNYNSKITYLKNNSFQQGDNNIKTYGPADYKPNKSLEQKYKSTIYAKN